MVSGILIEALTGEIRAHTLLAACGLAPPLLARFNNGLLYKFTSGDVCSPEDIRKPDIYRAVADHLGTWHASLSILAISNTRDLEAPGTNGAQKAHTCSNRPYPNLWSIMQSWIEALPTDTKEQRERQKAVQGDYNDLYARLADSPGLDGKDYVFSHCDLLSGNVIILQPESSINGHDGQKPIPKISFIDYEYATPAPAAFDIANHFAEWAGFDCDHSAMPTRSQRREFLTSYIRSFRAEIHPNISEEELQEAGFAGCKQTLLVVRSLTGGHYIVACRGTTDVSDALVDLNIVHNYELRGRCLTCRIPQPCQEHSFGSFQKAFG